MSEQFWLAILGLLATLIAAFGSQILAARQAAKQLESQRQLEEQRRKWEREDSKRDREKEVFERRCEQAERFAEAATEAFRLILDNCYLFLRTDDKTKAVEKYNQYNVWSEQRDRRIFASGPAIRALRDDELLQFWLKMGQAHTDLAHHCDYLYSEKFIGGRQIDEQKMTDDIRNVNAAYEIATADFYAQLDKIRMTHG